MKKYLFLITVCLCALSAKAQNMKITGKVSAASDKEPLIGVTIRVSGEPGGTVTDIDGNYTINADKDATLTFSMIGFKTETVKVGERKVVNVILSDASSDLNEVVVIGYGSVKKGDLTSSISAVKGSDLKLNTGNAMNALQGKINGVQISSTGSPGANPRVIIRGVSTINGSDPLYVVDGMPVGTSINFLNDNDIESIQVLKDASAAAIYGTRGSNGVILITTKQGKKGATKFTFSASAGLQTLKNPNMAKASEYEKVFKARYTNDGNTPVWNSKDNITDAEGTNWWNKSIRKTALVQNYNLGFSGGNDKLLYAVSIGYFGQDSQYKGAGNWQKLTARLNLDYIFNRYVKVGMDFSPKYETWKDTPNLMSNIMAMDPTTSIMRPKDEWTDNKYSNYARSNNNQVWNPVAQLARQDSHSDEYGLLATPYIQVQPFDGLTLRSQFGVNARFRLSDSFTPAFFIDNLEKQDYSTASRTMSNWVDWNWTNTATYMKTFHQKHNLNVMGGYTMERFQNYWLTGSRDNTPNNDDNLRYVSSGTQNQQASGLNSYQTLLSYLGRVMYNYDNRYYLTASVRVDGSSKFVKGHKYATFPAASVAWRISGEKFMQNQHIFDNLKLRAGWGKVGNQSIADAAYESYVDGGADYVLGSGATRQIGTAIANVGNSNLQWETVEDYDLGLDMGFLNNRLTATAEWFTKKSHNMLMQKDNLLVLGYPSWNSQLWENIGSMKATGWELSVNWQDKKGDFKYGAGINLSAVKNKALKLLGEPLYTGSWNGDYIIRNDEYAEISRFYGYVVDGIFQTQKQVDSYVGKDGTKLQPNAKPGDFIYKDLNGDGVINDKDKTYIGNAFPDLTMGINGNVSYKNFDLSVSFYGTFGNDIYNTTKSYYSGVNGSNVYAGTYNKCWHGEGTSNTYPRLSVNDANMNYKRVSTFFVENGSYLRCKLFQIGYTLPRSWIRNTTMRLSFSAQNLFTITGYSGMDPESASLGNSVTEAGIDYNGYPNPRTFLFGLNINF
ncbi:MAG: TonB-dependent receptor [Prevotella sp.]|nr:TonB-dependent receptor [Prevotella sp.]MCH3991190.1 TonB-dependent receptor [Prevotella sp.]